MGPVLATLAASTVKIVFFAPQIHIWGDRSLVRCLAGTWGKSTVCRQDVPVSNALRVDVANVRPVGLTEFQGNRYPTSS